MMAAAWLCCPGFAASPVNMDSLYAQLDNAIDSSHVFLQQKNERIASLKGKLRSARLAPQRYIITKQLCQEYIPFDNDSAITYLYQCLDLSREMRREDHYVETLIVLADQLVEAGYYTEASIHFGRIDTARLSDSLRTQYLLGQHHLYTEMGYYSHDVRLQRDFFAQARQFYDSLQTRLDSTSVIWLQLRTILLINEGLPSDAIAYSHLWQQQCQPQSRQWAIMAYYRSVIYGNMGNIDQQRYWLAQSALIDIRHAIMDQGALWSLAETLTTQDTDLDRAHRYIDFSWQCLVRFSSHMRSWLVAPIVTNINDEYKRQLQTANHRHISTIVLISFLTVGLLILLAYIQKKRRQLASARNDLATLNSQLSAMNSELSSANTALSQTNEQLRHAIIHLNDSNRVKDEYLGKFLSICSEYIDKLDNYRLKINRKLKANQHGDLLRMTGSDQLKADELKELFQHFDTLFLHLFPTFVADFNALLRPEERIEPAGQGQLSTDLRIFALIRLGIDESSKIAEFLHYSPNSIYAYRARIKNKAAGRRDDFERQVKEIGIYG